MKKFIKKTKGQNIYSIFHKKVFKKKSKIEYVYVVLCSMLTADKELLPAYVSSEGYKTFDDAVNWILSKEDKPEPMIKDCKCWSFRSKSHYYEVREIKIK